MTKTILTLIFIGIFFSKFNFAQAEEQSESTSTPSIEIETKKSATEGEIDNESVIEKTSELPKLINDILPQSPDFLNNVLHLQFFEEDFKTYFQYELFNNVLSLSGFEISNQNFNFNLKDNSLILNWPRQIFPEGKIEFIDYKGVTRFESDLKAITPLGAQKFQDDYYRICLIQSGAMSRLCSAYFHIEGEQIIFRKYTTQERILLNNSQVKSVGKIEVSQDSSISFVAEFANGISFDFVSKPSPLRLYEIKQLHDNAIECIGVEPLPLNNYQLLDIQNEPEYIRRLGLQSTIKDVRKFWKTQISPEFNQLFIRGLTGGIFNYTIPPEKIRAIKLNLKPTQFTQKYSYSNQYIFRGTKDSDLLITSKAGKVTIDKNKKTFSIQSELTKINEINQFQFIAEKGEDRYLGFYEIYRGLPRDISAHLVNIITPYGYIAINEISYLHWFSKVYNYNHYWLSNFRWGLRAQYLQNINVLKLPSLTGDLEKVNIAEANLDLMYRLTPGVWLKDETHGLILSFHNSILSPSQIPSLGIG